MAPLSSRPINPQREARRHIYNLLQKTISFPTPLKSSTIGCREQRGEIRRSWHWKRLKAHMFSAVHLHPPPPHPIPHFWDLLSLHLVSFGVRREEEEKKKSSPHPGQSVWQCVGGARGPVSVCQGRSIVEAGGHTSSRRDTDLCVLAFVSLQPATKSSATDRVSRRRESLWQPT